MILVNGKQQRNIHVSDRGFQFGDGLFETMEVYNHKPLFLERHFARLKRGCKLLKIPFPDIKVLEWEAHYLSHGSSKAVLKLIVTRGMGGRGYRQPETIQATRVFTLHPFPNYPAAYTEQGVNVRFCKHRLGLNPLLAGLKHLNRLEQILARSEWDDAIFQEGLTLDINGHVIEGTMSNVFMVKDQILYTPDIGLCGVAGIMRSIILEAASTHHLEVRQTQLLKQDIYAADEIFVTNSIIGIWPIKKIESHCYQVGQMTRQIMSWIDEYKQNE